MIDSKNSLFFHTGSFFVEIGTKNKKTVAFYCPVVL